MRHMNRPLTLLDMLFLYKQWASKRKVFEVDECRTKTKVNSKSIIQMEEGKGRVCVTGGTGFIASWIIKSLLEHGYSVNTTIRSDPGK